MDLRQTEVWGNPDDISTAPDDVDTTPDEHDTAEVLLSDDGDLDYYEAPRRRWLLPVVAGLAGGLAAGLAFTPLGDQASRWIESRWPTPSESLAASMPELAVVPAAAEPTPEPAVAVAEPTPEPPVVAAEPTSEPPVVEAGPTPRPVATPPRAAAQPVVSPDVPRIDELVVSADAASRLTVKCGDVSATGTSSVKLASVPAGLCTFEIVWFDDTYRMGMDVQQAQSLSCAREDGVLRCS